MTVINTGWYPEVSLEQKARNIIKRKGLTKEDVLPLLIWEGGVTPEFVRKLEGLKHEEPDARTIIRAGEIVEVGDTISEEIIF